MDLTISHPAEDTEREAVFTWLREFNGQENGAFMRSLRDGAEKECSFIARSSDGKIVGGLFGLTIHKWLKVNIMAITPDLRGQGIGTALMQRAEQHGAELGCIRSYVDTMSHQAPGFYEKLGYCEVGRLPDWDSHGHDKVFFFKQLSVT